MRDLLKYQGHLTLTAIDRKGNRFVYDTPNLITYGAATGLSHAMMGETAYMLKYLAVGTGNTTPARSQTALVTEVYRKTLPAPTFPLVAGVEIGQVEFDILLDFGEANGNALTEAGLFAANGTLLFARQIHSSVTKDSNYQLEYRWRIIFT
jgi:hypothetical protein